MLISKTGIAINAMKGFFHSANFSNLDYLLGLGINFVTEMI